MQYIESDGSADLVVVSLLYAADRQSRLFIFFFVFSRSAMADFKLPFGAWCGKHPFIASHVLCD